MPSTLSPTDLANVALGKVGSQPINSLLDQQSFSALTVNTHFNLCYLELSRARPWNCLMTPALLQPITQTPLPGINGSSTTITAVPWEINTFYAANSFVTFGNYYYQVLYDYTSTNNFINDLTLGALEQTDTQTASTNFTALTPCAYPSGWSYEFALPDDYQFVAILNGCECWDFGGFGGNDFQVMGSSLFTNQVQAVIQYVKNQPDCTQWDSMFSNAFTLKLASAIATPLRQDNGRMEAQFLAAYQMALSAAATRNGNEQQVRRPNIIRGSNFLRSRYFSQAG